MDVLPYRCVAGKQDCCTPIIAHIPHAATEIPQHLRQSIVLGDADLHQQIIKLTDWHTEALFSWVSDLGGRLFVNTISRLAFDPERFVDDASEPMARVGQGAFYTQTTDGAVLARFSEADRQSRVKELYEPYHAGLTALVASTLETHGCAVILDCHSFATVPLPSEPDQSPNRPDICIGTDPFHTPEPITRGLLEGFRAEGLSVAVDAPFAGTLVPLAYLGMDQRVISVMIEVRRGLYCDESTGATLSGFDAFRTLLERVIRPVLSNRQHPA